MGFSHPFGAYSVEGSLNEWFRVNLTAAGIPAWMPSARVVFDYPETPLISGYSGHAFSLTHLGAPEAIEDFQGRHVMGGSAGRRMGNLLRIDCWVSKQQAGEAYQARLRQMGDMVAYLLDSAISVPITNVYTGVAAPTAIGGLIRLGDVQSVAVPNPDSQNPDLHRRSFNISYEWIERR